MSGDVHVRFCERLGGRVPGATRLVVCVKSQKSGERVLESITRFVERKLKLRVNDQKSRVCKTSQCQFLGFTFWGKQLRCSPKALAKFKHQVRRLTDRTWGVSMKIKIRELSRYLRGWIHYFGIASGYQKCVELDHWIRRRVRMCYWKQWRKPRTKVRSLIKLGVPVKLAISCGITSKGYWRSAKTEGIHRGLNDALLARQELFSLRDGWVKIHYG